MVTVTAKADVIAGGDYKEPMQLVVITGAGASREVGPLDAPLPLMSDCGERRD